MIITLTTTDGSKFATFATFEEANHAARYIYRRRYSDILYSITLPNGEEAAGSIDLEPHSFHAGHQRKIITNHIRTFWGNVSKLTPGKYGIPGEFINFCRRNLNQIPAL